MKKIAKFKLNEELFEKYCVLKYEVGKQKKLK
jgi:hypothetical protein